MFGHSSTAARCENDIVVGFKRLTPRSRRRALIAAGARGRNSAAARYAAVIGEVVRPPGNLTVTPTRTMFVRFVRRRGADSVSDLIDRHGRRARLAF
ncbi:hypothetical protein EVAR_47446_1 [Eumeta japonica]|uniref:Uncharacterized protein n=1 Tax=Eumeta variegata TaxID=151549 RepID=A0A4C1XBD9_EUMVA|nr:hypothetical protein EVAR_47446_1 [Eumeta japonica]